MMVLCSNHSSRAFVAYAMQHAGKVGWLLGPSHWKNPRQGVPYALDNDAFIAWTNKTPWDESAWRRMLDKANCSGFKPMWALCPDTVADKDETIRKWWTYCQEIKIRGWKAAFAVQDGMEVKDVPVNADLVFVGGTTQWKWRTARKWCSHFPRVHIGRVGNSKLQLCEEMGAESVDGSGFMRETFHGRKSRILRAFVEGHRDTTLELPLEV